MENRFLKRLQERRAGYPLVIAHRGDSYFAPENTLEAARSARRFADAWELDVQLTRDGVPVVIHDDSLSRTTNVAERFGGDPRGQDEFLVGDFDFEEITTLDAGSWFVSDEGRPRSARSFGTLGQIDAEARSSYQTGQVRIPRLDEALTLTAELDWLVNVEIKAFPLDPPGLASAVLDAIERTQTADRVILSSFDHRIVGSLTVSRPEGSLVRGILTETPLWQFPRYATEIIGCSTVHLSAESLGAGSISYRRSRRVSMLQREEVESLAREGIPVLVYTVNEYGESSLASHLADIGVAGLFTDDPRGMRESFHRDGTADDN